MARSEARLLTEIWEDRDFLALTGDAQRLFMFLLSQPDLAHSGVIALRERRWSRKQADGSLAGIEKALADLAAARFLVVDWDSEEILVRSLIRRDRIFKQPNVMRAAVDNVPLIESQAILRALVIEMERIRRDNPDLTVNQTDVIGDMEKALAERVDADPEPEPGKAAQNPSPNPSGKGSGNPSAHPSPGTPGVRGDVRPVVSDSPFPGATPVPPPAAEASPSRQLALVPAVAVEAEIVTEPQTTQQLVGWWIDQCQQRPPDRTIGQMSKEIKSLIDQGIPPHHIRNGIAEWLTGTNVSPSSLTTFVNSAMNRRPRQSTRDERVMGWLTLEVPGQEAYA